MVWELIENSKRSGGIGGYEVLNGCVDDWKWQSDNGSDSTEVMAKTNLAIAARMAGTYHLLFLCGVT